MVVAHQDERPNIILIMTDQQRGDCLGLEGHPVLLTPNLDAIGQRGVRFAHCYSTCPSCIPARRSLLSGQFPATHGMVGFEEKVTWEPSATLPGALSQAGYHTALVGRSMHQYPQRKRFGYDHMVPTHDLSHYESDKQFGHGLSRNGWTARPWHLEEDQHPTHLTADEAVRFVQSWRDPSCPFFLTVSFLAPHPPLCPPAFYMERYLRMNLPDPIIGDWAQLSAPANHGLGQPVESDRVVLSGETLRSCLAGYYGLINHVDDQIHRIMHALSTQKKMQNTVVVFTSDHGEMLGDHHLFRKTYPYEASIRVPLLIHAPQQFGLDPGRVCHHPVCLEDIMPTLLDLAGVDIPPSVDGQSLVRLMRDQDAPWRDDLHGEHAPCYRLEQANHYLTNGIEKYIWFAHTGREQFFKLNDDPNETHDLIDDPSYALRIAFWKQRLIDRLKNRPEGFTDGKQLIPGQAYKTCLPHAGVLES